MHETWNDAFLAFSFTTTEACEDEVLEAMFALEDLLEKLIFIQVKRFRNVELPRLVVNLASVICVRIKSEC